MLTDLPALANVSEWREIRAAIGSLFGPQQRASNSSVGNRLTSLDMFTFVALAISVAMLLLACCLIASAAGEMSRSDDTDQELHAGPHCIRKSDRGHGTEGNEWRRAG